MAFAKLSRDRCKSFKTNKLESVRGVHVTTARIVVVTGAESGIGRATALKFARDGANVFAGDIRLLPENDAVYSEFGIERRVCDVRTEEPIQTLIDGAVAKAGRLDVLVNNAGIGMVKPLVDVSEDDWDRCVDTNLKGPFFGCKHGVKHMLTSGGGAIVNVASNAGLLPRAHDPVYSISKLAVVGLTKSLALCHARDRMAREHRQTRAQHVTTT